MFHFLLFCNFCQGDVRPLLWISKALNVNLTHDWTSPRKYLQFLLVVHTHTHTRVEGRACVCICVYIFCMCAEIKHQIKSSHDTLQAEQVQMTLFNSFIYRGPTFAPWTNILATVARKKRRLTGRNLEQNRTPWWTAICPDRRCVELCICRFIHFVWS